MKKMCVVILMTHRILREAELKYTYQVVELNVYERARYGWAKVAGRVEQGPIFRIWIASCRMLLLFA